MYSRRVFHENKHGVMITDYYWREVPDFCFTCEGLCGGESHANPSYCSPSGCTRGRIAFPTRKGSCRNYKEGSGLR